jgi:predicted aldo/keto reductase-like oxidoreductase
MLYRRFGRTELNMPVFSCGGMRYQHKWQDVPLADVPEEGQRNLEATIRRAVAAGINHIETARGYGSSERQLGLVLPTFPREEIIVQTKIGPTETGAEFRQCFAESLERLRLDHVDLLAIHGINTPQLLELTLKPGGSLQAARQLQREGKARHIGFSTHADTDTILAAIHTDAFGGFDYVNLHWYFILQRHWPAVQAATQRDLGVFIISPSDKGGKLYAPPETLVKLCAPLHPIVFNDLFCLARPQVHTLSIGAARPSDFDEHLKTLPLLDQAGAILPPIESRLRDAMRRAIGVDDPEIFALHLPGPTSAPGGLNLPVIVWLGNLARGWGMVEYGQMRFNMFGSGGHWFPGAAADVIDTVSDADLLAAAHGSPHVNNIPALVRAAKDLLAGEKVKRLSQS